MITISISDEQWKKLNLMKERGESFTEVLSRLLNIQNEDIGLKGAVEEFKQKTK